MALALLPPPHPWSEADFASEGQAERARELCALAGRPDFPADSPNAALASHALFGAILLAVESALVASESDLDGCHGYVVPGGFGERGWEGKILTARYCRTSGTPYLGLCLGMQVMIVEFARQLQESGKSAVDAAMESCRLRLRPILMTSMAFIFGVLPLMWA